MTVSLPLDIKALMSVTVQWAAFQGFDQYAEPLAYATPVALQCWIQPHGSMINSGQTALRTRDGTVTDPDLDLYFDGDNAQVRTIRLWDLFTPAGVATEGRNLQALAVETLYGPPFDNLNPWLVVVSI